mmetsp:Transcript_23589/g.69018  ORF Transcript_23589/g.69018 Transcript_23589/m.69018 type:complete len:551 (-) Transcript_23589:35-1687(-)
MTQLPRSPGGRGLGGCMSGAVQGIWAFLALTLSRPLSASAWAPAGSRTLAAISRGPQGEASLVLPHGSLPSLVRRSLANQAGEELSPRKRRLAKNKRQAKGGQQVPSATKRFDLPGGFDPATATEEEFLAALKALARNQSVNKILEVAASAHDRSLLTANMLYHVVAAEARLGRGDLAANALQLFSRRALGGFEDEEAALAAGKMIRVLCQNGFQPLALDLVASHGLAQLPDSALALRGDSVFERDAEEFVQTPAWEGQRSLMLSNLARGVVTLRKWDEAQDMLKVWQSDGQSVSTEQINGLLEACAKLRHLPTLLAAVEAMAQTGTSPDDRTFELISNAAVQSVDFVTGAVSMETLPDPICPEVAFIGRSNVGKSSLVNMICNRRALAYTSKTPGKTQQYNYFLVNGQSRWKPPGTFYLVDLPGVGYAKVPQPVRQRWLDFMKQYFQERKTLRVVFHLVDSRHGPVAQDEEVMQVVSALPPGTSYVVVLTKADKRGKDYEEAAGLVRKALERAGCRTSAPIVLTSSDSKFGRDQMWRYLRLAVSATTEK